jgi:hypothetical protein
MNKKTAVVSYVIVGLLVIALLSLSVLIQKKVSAKEEIEKHEWSGLDESVIEKYAEESGRTPSEPLLPVENGDLLLFLFTTGGFASGVISGYIWRKLFAEKNRLHSVEMTKKVEA